MRPTLIIDADDTLWEAEIYYEQCIADFGELMATMGFDREEAEHTVDEVEQERVPLVGYGPHEFARNLVLAYERLCERHGYSIREDVSSAVWEMGQVVLEPPMVLLDGVAEALPWLGERFRLILLTKGDRAVQEDKLERSGLAHHFEGVHVVQEKDAEVLRKLVADYDLQPELTWMVGNSPRSDINPALEAGIGAVHIPHTNTWSFEQVTIADPERVAVLNSFAELNALFFEANDEIRAIIFDWGGVMQPLPSESYVREWEERLALAPGALPDALWGTLWNQLEVGAITNDEYIQGVADRLGFLSAEAADHFTDQFYAVVQIDPAVVTAVRALRGRYKVALLTNAWPGADEVIREKHGLDVHAEFDVYINSADVGLAKPDPAIFRLMLERLGVAPQEAVFLDDSLRNVEAARALGIRAIHVADPAAALAELEALLKTCNSQTC
jgi:putative hydrolase of the HAD superfamily